jgi:spoIIIJ-associated protein
LSLTSAVEEDADSVRVDLEGEGGVLLVRRKGEALDALQHVANMAFRPDLAKGQHVIIDCLGFRRGKDEELRQMAKYLVEKARTTGQPQEIGPLNPYSRRLVHLAVAEQPDASSESIGDAYMKTVLISTRR